MTRDPFPDACRVLAEFIPQAEVEAYVRAVEHGARGDREGEQHWRQVAECLLDALRFDVR